MISVSTFLKKIITPYRLDGVLINLIILLPRLIAGYFLTFVYTPVNIGLPWSPENLKSDLFKLNPEFVEDVSNFGSPFDIMPLVFSSSAVITMGLGGILMILGLNTRITSFFVLITMFLTILLREWNTSWSILPTFILFCMGLFYLGFGSGKYGLDYYLGRRFFYN
jgi:putative oxidoreductase